MFNRKLKKIAKIEKSRRLTLHYKFIFTILLVQFILIKPTAAFADDIFNQGKLIATGGVTQVEGAGGSGLTTWALITGYGTDRGVGINAHHTTAWLSDFTLNATGVGVGLYDRVELSYTHQWFDTNEAGGRLGIGNNFVFDQDIFGAKIRLAGNAVYDQDKLLPQISVGVNYKKNGDGALVRALGSSDDDSFDYYIAATKILLNESLILNATARLTEANQYGILGYGGANNSHSLQGEFSIAYMFTPKLVAGIDYRTKPDNLAFAKEQDAMAAYIAYFLNKNLSITVAGLDLGDIALQGRQRGFYISLQAGF